MDTRSRREREREREDAVHAVVAREQATLRLGAKVVKRTRDRGRAAHPLLLHLVVLFISLPVAVALGLGSFLLDGRSGGCVGARAGGSSFVPSRAATLALHGD